MIKNSKKESANPGRMNNLIRLMIGLITFVILFVILAVAVTPSQYDIKVGDYAPSIIKATKDVVDEITTRENREREAAKVTDVKKQVGILSELMEGAVNGTKETVNRITDIYKLINSQDGAPEVIDETTLEAVNQQLEPQHIALTLEQLKSLKGVDAAVLDALGDATETQVGLAMSDEIFDFEEEEIRESIREELAGVCDDENVVSVFMLPVEKYVKYNVYYDDAATEAAKQEARDKTPVVKYVTGQVIVADGEQIGEKQYAMMETLGLVNESNIDIWLYIGIALLVVTMLLSVVLYLYMFEKTSYTSPKKLMIISIACMVTLLLCTFTKQLEIDVGENKVYVMPVTLGILLVSLLVGRRVALFINVPLSIVASMLSGSSGSFFNINTYTMLISTFVSGIAALRVLKVRQTRLSVLLSGIAAGFASVVSSFAVAMISSASIRDSLYISLYSGIAGPASAVICIALMPAFEALFNAITTTRLLEMSNPNHPLLRRFLLEAPGTYHHSIIVANLAEAAAAEIGANSLLARVGAYYHDIGKLMRPSYFTENQMGDNPHDRTDPRVSAAIITAHPKDGVQLMKEKRMPEEVKNIALTHHGTTPVIFFYNKALSENPDVNVDDFRYPGPKPHTKEEAIVMMADTVEAATRAITNPDKERVREVVEKLIGQKIEDGQLDDCDISFRDISLIESAFVTVLSGAFHERIEYPNVEIPKKHGEEEKHGQEETVHEGADR